MIQLRRLNEAWPIGASEAQLVLSLSKGMTVEVLDGDTIKLNVRGAEESLLADA